MLLSLLLGSLAFAQAPKFEPMRGVNRGQPKPPVAILVVGVNEIVGSVAEPGWPLIVGASRQPDPQTAAVPLPANLQVKVTNESGVAVPLSFERAPPPANVANPAALHWIAAESATAQLSPGSYRVTLVTDLNPPTGWQIEVGEFRIAPPNPDNRGMDGYLALQRAALLGRDDEVLAEADRQIAAHGSDPNLWIAKGDILMMKDKPDEALLAFNKALDLQKQTDREPIAIVTRRRNALLRSLEKRGVIPPRANAP